MRESSPGEDLPAADPPGVAQSYAVDGASLRIPAAKPDFAGTSIVAPEAPSAFRAVIRILAFFVLFAAELWVLDFAIDAGLRRIRTSDFGVSNRIVTGQLNADIIISGSSRALVHYDPRVIQAVTGFTAFNIGRNGSQTDMQVAVLATYLQHNARPRLVVHNLDLFSFVTSREIYDPAQYLPYLDQPPIYAGIRRVYPDAWKWKHLPLYGYVVEDMRFTWMLGLKGLLGFQPAEDHIQGFVPRHLPWTGDFDAFRAANPHGVRFEIESRGVRDLEDLIELCRQQGIALVLVYSPEFVEMQALEQNRHEVFAKFRELSERFHVPVWDFSDSPLSHDRSNFYNSQHLNAGGAEAFSADLARRLVQSGLLTAGDRSTDSH